MSRNLLGDIFGGQILVKKGITRHWSFFLYIFLLVLFYISIHFGMRNTMRKKSINEEIVKNMRSEYMGKYNSILYQSKRGEIEELLDSEKSGLVPPVIPPTRIELKKN